jgi:hypothetical protein
VRRLIVLFAALLSVGASYAAFQVYDSTISGTSRSNSFDASASHQSKLIISQTGDASTALSPGASADFTASVSNPNHVGASDETVSNLNGSTFSTSPDASCGSHLSVSDPSGSIVGQSVTVGRKIDGTLTVTADSSLPASCAGGSYVVDFGGTVSP